jgi:flagellin FlaB
MMRFILYLVIQQGGNRMLNKISKALKNLNRGQKGMTGLETAIILIAFVTVASVLAYAVLSAGIFSAEKGKETVYKGLEQVQGNMIIKGNVLGISTNQTRIEEVVFNVALTIPTSMIDKNAVVVNYWDAKTHGEGLPFTMQLSNGSTERGTPNMLEGDEQFTVDVVLPSSSNITPYDSFNIQLVPPTGATLTVHRVVPGTLEKTIDLY